MSTAQGAACAWPVIAIFALVMLAFSIVVAIATHYDENEW